MCAGPSAPAALTDHSSVAALMWMRALYHDLPTSPAEPDLCAASVREWK